MGTEVRRYETTHPWLNFRADLGQAPYSLWMNLGAIQSKCEHIANVMLSPDVSADLLSIYLAKGVQATTAIEGNTLSEEEVLGRIRGIAVELPPSKQYLGQEVDNVLEACQKVQEQVLGDGSEPILLLTVDKITEFNRTILRGLDLPEHVVPGEIRSFSVGVGHYRGAPAEDCEFLLQRLCDWINHEIAPPSASERDRIAFGVLRAVLAHLYLAWIHPFGDGNGRTARLIELQILLAVGVPNVAAHLLSNHYNQTRSRYYAELDRASKSGGNIIPFLEYAAQGMVDGLDEAINRIRKYQVELTWRDYVYSKFKYERGQTAERRRRLALDLWGRDAVRITDVWSLTPELAAAYAGKTQKTIQRDVNELVTQNMLQQNPDRTIAVNIQPLLLRYPHRKINPAIRRPH